jgi:membrane-associated phospholipid phosphatase
MRRWTGAGRAAAGLLAATAALAGAARAAEPDADEGGGAARPRGRASRFFEEHGARLLAAIGVDQAARAYDRTFGPSRSPLLFQHPPSVDRDVHDSVTGPSPLRGYVENYGLETLRYGVPAALILLDLRDRGRMAPDLLGFVETYYANRGLTSLLKNVTGRERPVLEYAAEEGAGPRRLRGLDALERNHQSFPSGHASGSFAFAAYLERALARRTGLRGGARAVSFGALYGVAGYIGWSRIRRGQHHLTDVVGGAALGVATARTCYRLNHPDEVRAARAGRRRLAAGVRAFVPEGGGVGVTVSLARPGPGRP